MARGTPLPLPHAYPFRLVERAPRTAGDAVEVLVTANAAQLRAAAELPSFFAVEVMAQAALLALPAGGGGDSTAEVRGGMLAGVESLTVRRPLRAGDRALASASVVGRLGAVVKVRAELVCDGEAIAEGELLLVLEDAVS